MVAGRVCGCEVCFVDGLLVWRARARACVCCVVLCVSVLCVCVCVCVVWGVALFRFDVTLCGMVCCVSDVPCGVVCRWCVVRCGAI